VHRFLFAFPKGSGDDRKRGTGEILSIQVAFGVGHDVMVSPQSIDVAISIVEIHDVALVHLRHTQS